MSSRSAASSSGAHAASRRAHASAEPASPASLAARASTITASARSAACRERSSNTHSSSSPSSTSPRQSARASSSRPAPISSEKACRSTPRPWPLSPTVSRVAPKCMAAGPSAPRSSLSAVRRLARALESSTSGHNWAATSARACSPGKAASQPSNRRGRPPRRDVRSRNPGIDLETTEQANTQHRCQA